MGLVSTTRAHAHVVLACLRWTVVCIELWVIFKSADAAGGINQEPSGTGKAEECGFYSRLPTQRAFTVPPMYVTSPRMTKLHDRTGDEMTLDEVERIAI
jgi:hypothetical protein